MCDKILSILVRHEMFFSSNTMYYICWQVTQNFKVFKIQSLEKTIKFSTSYTSDVRWRIIYESAEPVISWTSLGESSSYDFCVHLDAKWCERSWNPIGVDIYGGKNSVISSYGSFCLVHDRLYSRTASAEWNAKSCVFTQTFPISQLLVKLGAVWTLDVSFLLYWCAQKIELSSLWSSLQVC